MPFPPFSVSGQKVGKRCFVPENHFQGLVLFPRVIVSTVCVEIDGYVYLLHAETLCDELMFMIKRYLLDLGQ